MLRFEATLAYRHLRSGGGQTLLTVSAVAGGVIVIVFITSLIFGLRQRISELITDLLPHVTVSPLDQVPQSLASEPASGGRGAGQAGQEPLIISRIERQSQQRK